MAGFEDIIVGGGGGVSFTDSAGLAGALSDETGTGAAVFGTTPTISGPIISTTVEANTAGVGSPNILTSAESDKTLTNEGASALNYHTLPTAAAGLRFKFVVQDSDGIRVVAGAGDTIRIDDYVSAGAGYIQSSTIGATIILEAINATEWIGLVGGGPWAVDGDVNCYGSNTYSRQITLSADGTGATGAIVGSAANSLGHASGVTAVAAITGKRIQVTRFRHDYTFVTAAYTGGGNTSLRYDGVTIDISSAFSAATSFTSANSTTNDMANPNMQDTTAVDTGIGTKVILRSSAAVTQPGTAAGTVIAVTYYRVVTR